ncbi:general transcription factor IIF subunit 1 isoform X2 [Zootermopsis nevadensis]|uniref:general transcription factor IIF subunit 1 isoform X2 n=1 Tax=Zootermopsis nevadensis TaxID=136037 RepID=UPI000B8E9343|nr:general transcription factor IIF subunit 1 isoform X2 [Zootermopsis nevadensis]
MNNSQHTPGSSVQEYSIRVPKNTKKKYHVMRFTSSVNVDFSKWTQVKMERENNMREFRGGTEEEMPKFGAGSEFGYDAREEARRKKYGIVSRKYRPEDQPWILKIGGKTGKKFRGNREGGVAENASYYVFTHAPDGAIEAFPLQEWYNFQPIQRYKPLSAEEAEEQFGRRNKLVNYFSLMLRQRLRPGDEDGDPEDPEEGKTKKSSAGNKKELKISDMDEWIDSDDDDDDDSDSQEEKKDKEENAEKDKKKKTKKGDETKKKKKKKDSDDEAFEESDDGDEEGRELDYISDSSDSVSEPEQLANKELKGVAEEDALRKLLSSGEEDEEEEEEKEDGEKDSEGEEKSGKTDADADKAGGGQKNKEKDGTKKGSGTSMGAGSTAGSSSKKKKKKKKKKQNDHLSSAAHSASAKKADSHDSSSDFSSESSDSDVDARKKQPKDVKSLKEPNRLISYAGNSGASSRSGTPTKDGLDGGKRKLAVTPEPGISHSVVSNKKARLDSFSSATLSPYYNPGNSGSSDSGITEDAVRRYLMRKPMTTTELLQKFKSKKTGLTSDQLVNVMTQILKRINPVKQTIKGKMYLSIKA